jgi:2-methylcitrate dehydratase PrpD
VLSALLAADGFTGIPDVLEVEFGGFCGTMGGGSVRLERLEQGLGTRWEIESVGFKIFASCAAAHTSLEVARRLRTEHRLMPDDVQSVTVRASTHAFVHCGWPYEPTGVTAAQMNIPYGVARMLLDGQVVAGHFTEQAIRDPRTLELAARVRVEPDEAIDELGPERRYTVRVAVATADGRVLTDTAHDRPGSPALPIGRDRLEAKFRSLAEPVVGARRARELIAAVDRLEELDDVRALAALLRAS